MSETGTVTGEKWHGNIVFVNSIQGSEKIGGEKKDFGGFSRKKPKKRNNAQTGKDPLL